MRTRESARLEPCPTCIRSPGLRRRTRDAGFECGELLGWQGDGAERRTAVPIVAVVVGAAADRQPEPTCQAGVPRHIGGAVFGVMNFDCGQAIPDPPLDELVVSDQSRMGE